MKYRILWAIWLFSAFLYAVLILACEIQYAVSGDSVEYEMLEVPKGGFYRDGDTANCIWEMEIMGETLYLGSGHYGTNAGPVSIVEYNTKSGKSKKSRLLPEEEINRFLFLKDTIVTPGVDPRQDWSFGNWYIMKDGFWQQMRNLSGGVHVFDLIEHENKIFAGMGVLQGNSPIAVSNDDGFNFSPVKLFKNGKLLDTSDFGEIIRVYDFFKLNGKLYALFIYDKFEEIYSYNNGSFYYEESDFDSIMLTNYTNIVIGSKVVFKDKLFLATGFLYETEDMKNFSLIPFEDLSQIKDLYVYNDTLYILYGEPLENGTFKTTLLMNKTGDKSDYTKCFDFEFSAPPLSLAADDSGFYIGMGDGKNFNEKNGSLLKINKNSFTKTELKIAKEISLLVIIGIPIGTIIALIINFIYRINRKRLLYITATNA